MDEYIKKSDIKKAFLKGFTDRKKYPEFVNWMAKEAERIVSNMPYADVQPVCHGRWLGINEYCIKNGYTPSGMGVYYWCSECGKAKPKISDYCPNCGARMDLKEGDAE